VNERFSGLTYFGVLHVGQLYSDCVKQARYLSCHALPSVTVVQLATNVYNSDWQTLFFSTSIDLSCHFIATVAAASATTTVIVQYMDTVS